MSTPDSRRPSPFIRAVRGASPRLWPTRLRLMQLKAAYKANVYSGHPENMLDSIDYQESLIRRHKNGQRPVKASPAPVEAEVPVALVVPDADSRDPLFAELTLRSHKDGGPVQPGLAAAEHRLVQMKAHYAAGNFSGHPEGMLEDIEDEENLVRRLKAEANA